MDISIHSLVKMETSPEPMTMRVTVKGTSLGRYNFCHKITQVAGH